MARGAGHCSREGKFMRVMPTVLALAAAATFMQDASAETQTEIINEIRTVIYFDLSDEAVEKLVPEGWSSTPIADGAASAAIYGGAGRLDSGGTLRRLCEGSKGCRRGH